jgi:hypothetical protein
MGLGTRREPHKYHLPGMIEKWQEKSYAAFMRDLMRQADRLPPLPES